jgi:2-oxoglutarate ferredoxin oxidoreductase subunit delta
MSKNRYEIRVIERYCKGCGLCVEVCEQNKLYMSSTPDARGIQVVKISETANCTGCLKCATICPDAAIEIIRVKSSEKNNES